MSVISIDSISVLISLVISILVSFLIWKFLLVRLEKNLSNKWWIKLLNVLILIIITVILCYFLIKYLAIAGTGCLINPATGECTA